MQTVEHPAWEGARNTADLGGLPLLAGGRTAYGRVWRSAAPEWFTTAGWHAARRAGLSCVIDLRNDAEIGRRPEHPMLEPGAMADVVVTRAPLEDPDDAAFLQECGPWLDHPRAWAPTARHFPDRLARVFSAIAHAEGPLLIHCAGGRDRTGMVTSLLLALNGVTQQAIADNYEDGFRGAGDHPGHHLGYDPATHQWVVAPDRVPTPLELEEMLAERRPALWAWLEQTDVEALLLDAGLDRDQLGRVGRVLTS